MGGRVVVGYDGSPAAGAAAQWAAEEARLREADLVVLTAHGRSAPDALVPDDFVPPGEVLDAALRGMQEELAGALPPGGVVPRLVTDPGDAAEALVAASREAELLVVGARGRSGRVALMLGSVSLRCVQHAACPVTVVPTTSSVTAADGPTVVVGVDGSPAGEAALATGAEEAALRGGRLVAVHAVEWRTTDVDFLRPTREQLVTWGERLVARALEPIRDRHPDLLLEPRVVRGHPAEVIAREAEGADLLVLGSRGHGRLVGMLLGSVSLHLLLHARRPTAVVTTGQR